MRTLLLSIAGILCMLLHGTVNCLYNHKVNISNVADCRGKLLSGEKTWHFLAAYFESRGIPSSARIGDANNCCVYSIDKGVRPDSAYCCVCSEEGQRSLYYYIFASSTIAAHQARVLPYWSQYRLCAQLGGAAIVSVQNWFPHLSRMIRLPLYLATLFCAYKDVRYRREKRKMDSQLCYLGGAGETWSTAIGNRPIWNFYALKDLATDQSTGQCDYYCVSAVNVPDWMCNPSSRLMSISNA